MDIVFLGGLFPEELEAEVIKYSKGGIQFAANNLQWGIINGLDANNKTPIHICNIIFVGAFPNGYKKLFIKSTRFSHNKLSNDVNLGFINLFGISKIFRFLAGSRGLHNWARRKNSQKVIVIYSLHTPFLCAGLLIRCFFSKIKVIIIIPDLPEFMSDNTSQVYRVLKALDRKIINFCIKRFDAFVLVSECMTERMDIGVKPWILIEGIFDNSAYTFSSEKNSEKVIMYSGNLNTNQGIVELIESFSLIMEDNYRLWITGSGNGLEFVLKKTKNDTRIKYWSKLEQNDLFKLQQLSTLLINPFNPNNDKSRFFFPSKTMEYLASGTPTLMFKLPCIPEEYNSYVYYFKDSTIEGMKDRMVEICKKPQGDLVTFGKRAQAFILTKKNPKVQCRSFYNMLQDLFRQ